jgi:hypothetical protein
MPPCASPRHAAPLPGRPRSSPWGSMAWGTTPRSSRLEPGEMPQGVGRPGVGGHEVPDPARRRASLCRIALWARRPLALATGMNDPLPVPVSFPLCEHASVAACQLNCVWAFQGKSVPWVKAQPSVCTRCGTQPSGTQPRRTTRWGLGLPVLAQTPPTSRRAGRHGNSVGAPECASRVARPVDGPLDTAPSCEALIPKAKATAGEPIRIPWF